MTCRSDDHHRTHIRSRRRQVAPLEQDSRQRVHVAAVEKRHLTVNDRTLCGLVTVDKVDVYQDGRVARVEQRAARAMQSMRGRTRRDDAPTSAGGRPGLRTGGE